MGISIFKHVQKLDVGALKYEKFNYTRDSVQSTLVFLSGLNSVLFL